MSSFEELRNIRIDKLKLLEKAGVNPYPAIALKDYPLRDVISDFDKIAKKKSVNLAGRIMAIRGQGGLIFFNINDGTGLFQGLLKKDEMEEKVFDLFQNTIDIGDFIEISGKLFVTKRGEKTLQVVTWKILTKSLRPLPEKWHGIQDEEERLRKRYLDIIFNPEVKDTIEKRAKFFSSMRQFLADKNFMEVDTPVLENTAGGAEARPFVTHYNAYDTDVYLRISPELWLKRLMVAGFPKVYEIGRIFRNEGADSEHLQDYTQMEFYWAYADYNDGMKLVEEMYKYIAKETFGTLKFKIKGFDVDLGGKWEKYDYVALIKEKTGVDILTADVKDIEKKLQSLKIEYDKKGFNLNRAIDSLWKYCRKQIGGPGFLINVPVVMEPLAKRMEKDKNLVERFQVILAGSEMGKGFSELNDPIDQMNRFTEQAKLREGGDEEAQMMDSDFVEALEYGMPPTCGFGLSERLFSFFCGKPVRECQIFPFMRPKE
ncbi:MAG: lysine--tRNA ligase [Candidatus Paceibacterota bacterium]|jgi:lysyl-tRNA synthetase class 2